jgi:hypothetical protein
MTPNMARFIEENEKYPVVFGQRLTPDGDEVISLSDMKASDRTEYQLRGGARFILLDSDKLSCTYSPKWYIP